MECVFACPWNCVGHNRMDYLISKGFDPNALFIWKRFGLLLFIGAAFYGFNGVSFRSKSKIEKEATHLGPYQYLLFDSGYVYACLSYGSSTFKRVVVVLFGLGNCFVRDES